MALDMAGSGITGPLGRPVVMAGADCPSKLQHAITSQRDRRARQRLHLQMEALPEDDERRVAWMSMGRGSYQWVTSWPTDRLEYSDAMFREVITGYMGCESPSARDRPGYIAAAHGPVWSDPHGRALALTRLPGGEDIRMHDGCGGELYDIMQDSGLHTQLTPHSIFHRVVDPAVLTTTGHDGGRPAIIPDAAVDVSLPAAVRGRGARMGPPLPVRRTLLDTKMVLRGNAVYLATPRAREGQTEAVQIRAERVDGEYRAHARDMDRDMVLRRFAQPGSTAVIDELTTYGPVRGAVFGAYFEWSRDVDALLVAAATHFAREHWRRLGMRTEGDLRAMTVAQYRRRLGCRVAYCVTWHRLARVFMVGLPRWEVEALRARDRAAAAVAAPPRQLAPGVPPRIGDVMQGAVMRADGAPRPGA
jgi:hypothetical protein